MTLPEFVLRQNEHRRTWLGVRRWIPTRTDPYSWPRSAAVTLGMAGVAALAVGALAAGLTMLVSSTQRPPTGFIFRFLLPLAVEFGACVGLCWSVISRLCWNRRAAQLALHPTDPQIAGPWARVGFVRRFGLGGVYTLILGLALPLVLFHGLENTRAAWAWRQTQARLKAAGECFELSCIIPAPARDEENFFATPFWSQFAEPRERPPGGSSTSNRTDPPVYPYTTNFSLPAEPETIVRPRRSGIAREPFDGRIDLAAWAAHFRRVTTDAERPRNLPPLIFPLPDVPGDPAKDVLVALSKFDATLAEFAAAAPRPRNRYPIRYEDGFNAKLPQLAALKSSARICQLRAVARMTAGDTTGAAADVHLAFRLGESLREEPLLISALVRIACDSLALKALWHGLADHRWTEFQLAEFQSRLTQLNYTDTMIRALEGERAEGNEMVEWLVRSPAHSFSMLDNLGSDQPGGSRFPIGPGLLVPTGWFRQNQIALLDGYQQILDHTRQMMNRTNRIVALAKDPSGIDPTEVSIGRMIANPSPFHLLVKMLLPAIAKATSKANRAQATAQLGVVACALERHRLAHGSFPASLTELVPAYLPVVPADWMGGQPLHYQRTDDGWFRLWSIGEDGKDDGGVFRRTRNDGRDLEEILDWPWPQPLPTREPRLF